MYFEFAFTMTYIVIGKVDSPYNQKAADAEKGVGQFSKCRQFEEPAALPGAKPHTDKAHDH